MPKKIIITILISFILISGVLTFLVHIPFTSAQDYFSIAKNGGEQEVDKHGECRIVINNGDRDIFIPTKTASEWLAFRVNKPSGIILGDCSLSLGSVCTSDDQCGSGHCYVDEDGDRYAPASGTKRCQSSSQLSGVDCDDSDPTVYPGVVVGTKSCSSNNYYYVSGTPSVTGTNYCRYRSYHSQDKVCQSDGTISDPSCSSYSTYNRATCGSCEYAHSDLCSSSVQDCYVYSVGTSCGSCSFCNWGNCLTCTWQYNGSQDIRAYDYSDYISCNISNNGKLVWSQSGGGCSSKASKAHTSAFYSLVTVFIQKCVCQ